MDKTYKIRTIEDVLSCVHKDNIDCFMIDFRRFIELSIDMKELVNRIGNLQGIPKAGDKNVCQFDWIDDGKNKVSMTITTKNK